MNIEKECSSDTSILYRSLYANDMLKMALLLT